MASSACGWPDWAPEATYCSMAVTKASSAFSRSLRKALTEARGRWFSISAKRIRCSPRSTPTVAGTIGWRSHSTWTAWPASVTCYTRRLHRRHGPGRDLLRGAGQLRAADRQRQSGGAYHGGSAVPSRLRQGGQQAAGAAEDRQRPAVPRRSGRSAHLSQWLTDAHPPGGQDGHDGNGGPGDGPGGNGNRGGSGGPGGSASAPGRGGDSGPSVAALVTVTIPWATLQGQSEVPGEAG